MATEVNELLITMRLDKEAAMAGLAAANDDLRKVATAATKAEQAVAGLGTGVKVADREFSNAGRSIGAITRGIDGTAAAAAAANRVLTQHADAVAKLRAQHEREGRTAAETAEALRRLDVVRDNGLAKARAAGARVEAQFIAQGTATGTATDQLGRFGSVADQVQRSTETMGSRFGVAGTALSALGVSGTAAVAALAAIGTGLYAIAQAGDQATATLGKLRAATGSLDAARDVYEALFQSSQKTGISVAEAAGTFARFQIAAGEIGATRDQVLKLVEGLQKVAIVSGTSGAEGAAAMQQLGQALASGKLNGDELRSLMENMPSLAQALARELGTSMGALRAMGEAGQLTADKVFPALLKATEKMAREFDGMPMTMGRAKDILLEATSDFGQRLDKIARVSQTFAKFMQEGAAALRAAGQYFAPSEMEAADKRVRDALERYKRAGGAMSVPERQGLGEYREPAAVTERQRTYEQQRDATNGPRPSFAPSTLSDAAAAGRAKELKDADEALRRALADQAAIQRDARELQRAEADDASRKAAESARASAKKVNDDLRLDLFEKEKLHKTHADRVKSIEDAAGKGAIDATEAARQRKAVNEDLAEGLKKLADAESKGGVAAGKAADKRGDVIEKLNLEIAAAEESLANTLAGTTATRDSAIALETESRIRAAGIPDIEKRTAAQKRDAEIIETQVRNLDRLKVAQKSADEEARKAKAYQEKSWQEVGNIGERAMERVGDAAVNAMFSSERRAVSFGNVLRGVAVSVAADFAKLALINPFLNWAMPTGTPRSTLSGAFGGGGLGDLLGLGGMGNMFGAGGSVSSFLFGAPAVAGPLMPGMAALPGATSGILGSGGNLFGMAGIGGLFQGAGIGAGIGGMTAGLLGGNSTYGAMGGAAGALLGQMLIPIPGVGALIGGLLGGAGGGLIGPKESVKGWSYAIRSDGEGLGAGVGGQIKMTDVFYNESGKAQFDAANQSIAQINEFLAAQGLTVQGARSVGGNKNGPDASWGGAASFGDALADLRFGSSKDARLDSYLSGKSFDDPAKLAEAVQGFTAAAAAIDALGAEAVPAFTASLKALNDNFDAGVEQAKKYGLAEDNLTSARAKALAALEAQRTETLRQSDVSLDIRRLAASGQDQAAELARQAEAARQELASVAAAFEALAISAEDKAARLVALEEVQAAERADIIARYGEQAASALRQAGGSIRAYLDGLLTGPAAGASPTDRLAAAQTVFDRDRTLALGGDRDALGRVTSSADALLTAGRDVYASGAGYQAILGGVTGSLSSLPVVASYDAMMAGSLTAIQEAVQNGTLNTSTTILPGGNIVQLAGGLSLGGVEAALAAIDAELAAGNGMQAANLGAIAAHLYFANQIAVGQHASIVASHASLVALHATAVAAHATLVQSEGALYALGGIQMQAVTATATAAQIAVDVGAALGNHLAAGNILLAGIAPRIDLAANDNRAGLAALATIAVDASAASTLSFAAMNTILVDTAAAATKGQALANTIAAQINGDTSAIRAYASFIDNTLKAVSNYILDLRARLDAGNAIAVNAAIASAAGLGALATIAVDASAASTLSFAAMNTILANADINTTASLAAANTIAASNATAIVAALNAGNTIAADGNTRLASINAYASFIDNTGQAANNYSIEQIKLLRDLLAALAKLDASVREVGAAQIRAENDNTGDVVEAVRGIIRPLERAIAQ